jgi:hypothetical protein
MVKTRRRLSLPPTDVSKSSMCSSPSTITTCSAMSSGHSSASDIWGFGPITSLTLPEIWYEDELNTTRWRDNSDSPVSVADSSKNDIPRMPSRLVELSRAGPSSPIFKTKDATPILPRRFGSSESDTGKIGIKGMEVVRNLLSKQSSGPPTLASVSSSGSSSADSRSTRTFSALPTCSSLPDFATAKYDALKPMSPKAVRRSSCSFTAAKTNHDAVYEMPSMKNSSFASPTVGYRKKVSSQSPKAPNVFLSSPSKGPIMKLTVRAAANSPKSYVQPRIDQSVDRHLRRNSVFHSLTSILEGDDEYSGVSALSDVNSKRSIRQSRTSIILEHVEAVE